MGWSSNSFCDMADLYLAYRKAKVNMFYERDHVTAIAFAHFEKNLTANLDALLQRLNSGQPNWMLDDDFVGTFEYVPKSIEIVESPSTSAKLRSVHFVTSDPDDTWRAQCKSEKALAQFRIIGRHPIEFHVISALWIQKVGHKFDALLDDSVYGSRLKRQMRNRKGEVPPSALSLGSFRPYPYGFKKWRSDGLAAMENALQNSESIVAVTADLRRFYHEVSPSFLISRLFLERFGIELTEDEFRFTSQLISAIGTWARKTPEHSGEPLRGLPVGLSAPRLIANVVLCEFDRFVKRRLSPLYYGRYVDDVFLVLSNGRGLNSSDEVWNHLIEQSEGLLEKIDEGGEPAYRLNLEYSQLSRLRFAGDKQKVFVLKGTPGQSLLQSIAKTIRERSSDWRLLPDLPSEKDDLATDFIAAGNDATEEVDNLRKAEGISIQRLQFALRLRNFEAVQRDLQPEQWRNHRERFYRLTIDHILTAQGLFAYHPYVARIFSLSISCGDWTASFDLISRIRAVLHLVGQTTSHERSMLLSCQKHIARSLYEALVKSLPRGANCPADNVIDKLTLAISELHDDPAISSLQTLDELLTMEIFFQPSSTEVKAMASALFEVDLGRDAFRGQWLDDSDSLNPREISVATIALPKDIMERLRLDDSSNFLKQTGLWKMKAIPTAVAFPTRPLTLAEITQLDQASLDDFSRLKRWARALRGSETPIFESDKLPNKKPSKADILAIPNTDRGGAVFVAMPCFLTKNESWVASIDLTPDPDPNRYFRLNRLINDVIQSSPKVQYLVLPELALPRRWFNRFAHKLTQSGVSLITGLEYLHWGPPINGTSSSLPHAANAYVSNEVRASLITNLLGYRSHVTYIQEKERPALREERDLNDIAGKKLKARKPLRKPIIRHGELHFGILICSELTNIDLRKPFRGLIDALFVLEWNKDTNSFSSLVEASALDIHCYVLQANNRAYGDCRVRAPYRQEFKRDVARVKGGEMDYFVIARIDVPGLRSFQSFHRSPEIGEFKPTPDGFEIDDSRYLRPS